MSDPNEDTERNQFEEPSAETEQADTDRLEGSYTEVDGQAPHERTVAGAYTRTEGAADDESAVGAYTRTEGTADDESAVGDYTSTEEHPETHDAAERHGKFVRSSDAKPHPGPHHV